MKKFNNFIYIICGVVGALCGVINCAKMAYATNDVQAENETSVTQGETNIPQVYIKAINPGYTVDGVSNVGEMIEISRSDESSDAPILLAGLSIGYTNSSGTTAVLVEFPEHFWLSGENIVLRLASSPEHELANLVYTKTLAMKAGPVTLNYNGAMIDSVCWTGKDGCMTEFKSTSPTVLVRASQDNAYQHLSVYDYEMKYDPEAVYMEPVESGDEEGRGESVAAHCAGLQFSEILSYYAESKEEQFVEIYNAAAEQILLDGCILKYKNKSYNLTGILKPEEYAAVYPVALGFSLTKNPTNANTLEIIDVDGTVVDTLEYYNGQKKATAWAWIGYGSDGEELWRTTYAPTPGEANNYQEFRTCEEGKVINEATGNCVKVTTVTEKICAVGQYLNLATNRCKKIEEAKVTECKEGYYLYEGTGRCRKIVENTGANYSVMTEEYEEKSSFVALYAVAGVVAVGVIYVIYEFRGEIKKWVLRTLEKIRRAYRRVRQKLSRGAGRH